LSWLVDLLSDFDLSDNPYNGQQSNRKYCGYEYQADGSQGSPMNVPDVPPGNCYQWFHFVILLIHLQIM
jgi:hypothetical protein